MANQPNKEYTLTKFGTIRQGTDTVPLKVQRVWNNLVRWHWPDKAFSSRDFVETLSKKETGLSTSRYKLRFTAATRVLLSAAEVNDKTKPIPFVERKSSSGSIEWKGVKKWRSLGAILAFTIRFWWSVTKSTMHFEERAFLVSFFGRTKKESDIIVSFILSWHKTKQKVKNLQRNFLLRFTPQDLR